MTTETSAATETRGTGSLWFGVLAAPVAWFTMLLVDYAIEEVIACTPGAGFAGTILGLDVRAVILGVNAVLLVVALAALTVSVVRFRGLADDEATGRVARWMAGAGIINSVVFGLVIAVGFAPPLILDTCVVTP